MIGPLEETTVWNKKKEKVDILFFLRTDQESKYQQYRDLTTIRNILDETPLTAQLSFGLVDWVDSSKYLDTNVKDPAGPQFEHKVINQGKFNYMAVFRRSIAMYSNSRTYIQDSHWSSSYITALSLVESFRVLLAPALLCHKEPARRIQSPLLGALERKIPLGGYFACSSLVLYGIRAPIIGPFRAWKPPILMP